MPNLFELPGPEGNTIVGNLAQLGEDPLGFLTHCGTNYQDIVPIRLGLSDACLLTQPNHIEQVLKDRESFIKSRGFRALQTLLGEGLLTSEGETWFRQRRLAQPIFHQKRINGYGETMVARTQQMLQTWQDQETRDIHADMMRLTLNIVMKTIFDQEVTIGESSKIAHALDVAMDWFDSKRKQNFLIWEWFPRPENIRYKTAIEEMDQTIYALIQHRRQSSKKGEDLLSMLMAAEDADDGSRMSDKQLRDEVATLMLAGHETTANALSWTWMLLCQYPHIQRQLHEELDQVLSGHSPTIEVLPKLRYAKQIIKEAMRLFPPVALIGREAMQDYNIDDCLIPEGCLVIISQWVMHRNPRFFKEPDQFKPERWTDEFEKQLPRGVYIPFGDGPRICIGQGFAMMEAILLLSTIAQKYEVTLAPDCNIVPQPSITLRPEHGIRVNLNYR